MEIHASKELKLHLDLLMQRFASVQAENDMLRRKLEVAGIELGQNTEKLADYDNHLYSMKSLYEENTKLRHSLETFRQELDQMKSWNFSCTSIDERPKTLFLEFVWSLVN
jgi:regulator of replication initiation timing